MAEVPRSETIKELKEMAAKVVDITHERGVPIIEKISGGQIFSWPSSRIKATVAEQLEKVKDNVGESERIKELAKRAGIIATNAVAAKDALVEIMPFEFGVIRDLEDGEESRAKGNIGVSFRGVRYQVTYSHEDSTSTVAAVEIDEGGLTQDEDSLLEMRDGLFVIINNHQEVQNEEPAPLPPAA